MTKIIFICHWVAKILKWMTWQSDPHWSPDLRYFAGGISTQSLLTWYDLYASAYRIDPIISASQLQLKVRYRPRYHFSGVQGSHYERPPYRNHSSGAEQSRHVSRFIALAKVGNKEKKKWLYAFNITPLKTCPRQELVAQPVGVTDMPFREEHISIQVSRTVCQFGDDLWHGSVSVLHQNEGGIWIESPNNPPSLGGVRPFYSSSGIPGVHGIILPCIQGRIDSVKSNPSL